MLYTSEQIIIIIIQCKQGSTFITFHFRIYLKNYKNVTGQEKETLPGNAHVEQSHKFMEQRKIS